MSLLFSASVMAQPQTQNPHGKIKWDCLSCHTSASWSELQKPLNFWHGETGFSLQGAHKTTSCLSCHTKLKFTEIASSCADCHSDVHRGQFGLDCQSCHTPQNWNNRQDEFTLHAERGFPLTGVHALADCQACHINQQRNEFAGAPTDCNGCHLESFMATANPSHTLAKFDLNCVTCHKPLPLTWRDADFQHTETFTLNGAHFQLECNECHATTYTNLASAQCLDCHFEDYQLTSDPSHSIFGFPEDCIMCHNEEQWAGAIFNHLQASGFELLGAHAVATCSDCHSDNQFTNLSTECFSCHENDFNSTQDPEHLQGGFPTDCVLCHQETAWTPSTFDHNNTNFPLDGVHLTILCNDCHINSQFQGTQTACYSCHQAEYDGVADPDHPQNNFSQSCELCHNTEGWSPAFYGHYNTQFPLTGAHIPLDCIACHENGYTNMSTDCYSCHEPDYQGVSDPEHAQNNFNQDCTQCHTTEAWTPAFFDHANTQFPLDGAHVPLDCIECHANGYSNIATDCFSCHEPDFQGVTDPNHVQNNFVQDCTQCHTTEAWSPSFFDHANTQFPLDGAHVPLDCIDCHANGYSNIPTDCFSCHEPDFQGVTDPDHAQNNFSQDCTQCHTTEAWSPATFDHANTQFPLDGAHVPLDCIECHANGYSNIPTDCFSCHEPDFQGVTDPDHVQNNFSQDCTECHSTEAWSPATFDHNNTQFPLDGAHVPLACIECHANGYSGTATDCYSCHEPDFQGVTDPDHVQNNFDHDCSICHSTSSWSPATFDHDNTQFPLTGEHLQINCLDCHSSGFSGTPTDCFACHESDYNSTNNPNHQNAGFPTDCESCHNTSNWNQTTWDHDNQYFPIYSGKHKNKWNDCADCHINNNFSSFECIFCHEHRQSKMASKHQGVSGYSWVSTECYRCHPDGKERIILDRTKRFD